MDDKAFADLLASAPTASPDTAAAPTADPVFPTDPSAAPGAPVLDDSEGPFQQGTGAALALSHQETPLSDPSSTLLDAPLAGASKAAFQTKDFLTGETPPEDQSAFRKNVEQGPADQGLGYGLVSGVSEFATGMLGAGKIAAGLKGVKYLAGGLETLEGIKGASTAAEVAKAATVGAIAFDPHAERLSNLVQSVPALQNPVSDFLAAKPGDSAAIGRVKNALESIGMDAAVIGTLTAGMRLFKALRTGDHAEVSAATKDTQAAINPDGVATEAPGDAAPLSGDVLAPGDVETKTRDGSTWSRTGPDQPWTYVKANADDAFEQIPFHPDDPSHADNWHLGDRGMSQQDIASLGPEERQRLYANSLSDAGGEAPPLTVHAQEPVETHTDNLGQEWTREAPDQPLTLKQPEPDVASKLNDTGLGDEAPKVEAVDNPTQGAGEEGLPAKLKAGDVSDEQLGSIMAGIDSDMKALSAHGSWDDAINAGHIFGKGGSIPWQKLVGGAGDTPSTGLDAFVSRVAQEFKADLDDAKGGDVLSDARVEDMVQQRVELYGEDPAALYGMLQAAGKDASAMAANMEASLRIAQRGQQDAFALASRIMAGAVDNKEAAVQQLKDTIRAANVAWGAGQSMRAAAGRTLRRAGGDFRLSASDLAAIDGMDGDALATLLSSTGGDPRSIKLAVTPTMLSRITDGAQFLYVNNLLWGLRTHFVNFATNGYMLFGRPAERILGSYGQSLVANVKGDTDLAGAALRTRQESLRQYTYMASNLMDSWKTAVETFNIGDSVLTPHTTEANTIGHSLGTDIAQKGWRPWDSVNNVLYNAVMVAAPKTLGLPTRSLGAADELVKNVVYRSKVTSTAHVDGLSQGLEGDALTDFVRNRLYDSFDDAGRAIDPKALQEAQIATFQQDLEPGSLGKGVQNFTSNVPIARFVVPFVKTPTNVLRLGIKMTPGLNMAQAEYRSMIKGQMGPEVQAQAIGQMAMGSLFMGVAGLMAYEGRITGGGPSDPKLMAALQATGWQPYSFVYQASDGTRKYVNFGRYDPVATPLGMIADITSIIGQNRDGSLDQKVAAGSLAVLTGLAKSISQKTYLKSLDDTIQALTNPDKKMEKLAGTMAANMIPGSSGLRFMNPDPNLRDARHFLDYIMSTVPGLSETVPAKRDMWGEPLTVHKGLWVDSKNGIVDAEIRRMADDHQVTLGPPSASTKGGVDLRDVTMADGKTNAYDKMQQLAAKPTPRTMSIKDVVGNLMESDAYKRAPDGDAATKGTKLSIIATPMHKYHTAAESLLKMDPVVRAAEYKKVTAVASAYAAQSTNPTPSNARGDVLKNLGAAFGVDLSGVK